MHIVLMRLKYAEDRDQVSPASLEIDGVRIPERDFASTCFASSVAARACPLEAPPIN